MPSPEEEALPSFGLAALVAASVVYWIASSGQAPVEEIRVGLHRNDPRAAAGYTLFGTPGGPVFLIDNAGRMVQRWKCRNSPISPARSCCRTGI